MKQHRIKVRLLSMLTALTMLMSLIGAMPLTASAEDAPTKLGDYVQMGTYGQPILWRCVAFEKATRKADGSIEIDSTDTRLSYQAVGKNTGDTGYLPLMLADTSICNKMFDAEGDDKTGSHGRDSNSRTNYGSNYWGDSNIRDWLNSADKTVTYTCGNPSYLSEKGFLTNFSNAEKAAIKSVTQKSLLTEADKDITGASGSAKHAYEYNIEDVVQNYANAYSEQVTDTMFLLDVRQVKNVYDNYNDYYKLSVTYWLRSPSSGSSATNVRAVDSDGYVSLNNANSINCGVRPAFFLNPSSAFDGSGTEAEPYTITASAEDITTISTLAELEAFRDSVNGGNTYEGKTVTLTADIDMSGKYGEGKLSWTPIGNDTNQFKGTFDGGNNKITGLYINSTSDNQGLFGYINGGTVKNLGVDGTVSGKNDVGGVVGYNKGGTVTSCYNTGTVSSTGNGYYIGGVVGYNNGGTVINCYNTGTVSGDTSVGGVVGSHWDSTVTSCYNTGTVSSTGNGYYIGGVVGMNFGTVTSCYYLTDTATGGISGEVKTEAKFASGEVAWLMQNGQSEQAWGQTLSGAADAYPTLTSDSAKKVYKVAFMSDSAEYAAAYANPNGTVALPTTNPTKDGYTFTKWSTAETGGTEFTAATAITEDTTVYAQFTQSHTHTLTHHEAVAATCTAAGTGEYWKCEGENGCNKMFSDANGENEIDSVPTLAIDPTAHSYGAWSIITAPKFTETGIAERICTENENHKDTVILPILGNNEVWKKDLKIEPTETENGLIIYTSQYGTVKVIVLALNPNYDYGIKYENGKAVVTVPQDGTYTVIFAAYDNGRLLSVNAQDIQLVKGENSPISPQNFNSNGKVKVMLWDSLKGMKPLCAADGN